MSRTNLSWEFTTHPCRGHPDGTDRILRPMMPATISKGNDKIDVPFLVDSGADFPSIPRDLAEALSINIDDLPKDKISGVGGISDIAWVDLDIEFGQRGRQFSYLERSNTSFTLKGSGHRLPQMLNYGSTHRLPSTDQLKRI